MVKILLFFLMAMFLPIATSAQVNVEISTEIFKINGENYYMHYIRSGETLYSISKAYHVSIEDITKVNPKLDDGLQADMVIIIPVHGSSDEVMQPFQNEAQNTDANYGSYSVGHDETLYLIAKKLGIDLADFKALNPGLSNEPAEGTVIKVPPIHNEKAYLVHKVELNEKTSSLLARWNADEDTFRALNPSVGTHVFSEQMVLIPIENAETSEIPTKPVQESVPVEESPVPDPAITETEPVQESVPIEESPVSDPAITETEPVQESVPVEESPVPTPAITETEPVQESVPIEESPVPAPAITETEPVLESVPIEESPVPDPVITETEPVQESVPVEESPVPDPAITETKTILESVPVEESPGPDPAITETNPIVVPSDEEIQPIQNEDENKIDEIQKLNPNDDNYRVGHNETLFTIAKKFGIDLADFKALNPGLANEPAEGTIIKVPPIRNEKEYLVHKVEVSEKTSSLLAKWKVDETAFRAMNPAVGSHVFSDQMVLIPIEKAEITEIPIIVDDAVVEEPVATEEPVNDTIIIEEPDIASGCVEKSENAHERYKVALLIPLYLNEVESIEISPESLVKSRKARPLSFLQFYEGFMIAIDSLTKYYGLNLDMTVMDVTENLGTAKNAVSQLEKNPVDLIVGPFFSKSFGVVQEYAKNNETLIVNPLSMREKIVEGNPYVVKLKPNVAGQLSQLTSLINQFYGDSNVSILYQSGISESTSAYIDEMERQLKLAINSEVVLKAEDFLRYAQDEARRKEMGNKLPSTIEVEGQIFATKDLKNGALDNVWVENTVGRYVYDIDGLSAFNKNLSEIRNNLVIAYGNDNVFATQILNKLNKTAETHPITLVAMPDWSGLNKLLVDNLLKTNAIYFSEGFIDYNSNEVKRFILQFRKKYACEPMEYAFCGFDVAWYFMNAFMRFGHEPKDCLSNFETPLLLNSFCLLKNASENGLENYQWSIYQYDSEKVELKRIDLSNTEK